MKFASYLNSAGEPAFGVIEGERIREIASARARDLATFLSLPEDERQAVLEVGRAKEGVGLSSVSLLPVIPHPGKVICLGLNYTEHAKEGGFEVPSHPALFLRARSSLIAHGEPIIRPKVSEKLDYEAELAVVIGKRCRHVSKEAALDYVGGYTVFNDGSVRDYQRLTPQWTAGKNFDGTGALGPYLVTPDELPPGASGLRIESRLNGRVMQSSSTSDMIFDVGTTIEFLSAIMTLEPGDVIATGTPPGVGHARKPPVWMKDGDVCEIEVEGICILRNPIVDEVAGPKVLHQ